MPPHFLLFAFICSLSSYELFQKFDAFGEKEYRELYEHSEKTGIEFLSTAFDTESADYLDSMMGLERHDT